MEPVQHMTFLSPEFVLIVLLIAAITFILRLAITAVGKMDSARTAAFLTPKFVITLILLAFVGLVIYIAFYGPVPVGNDIQIAIFTTVIINGLPELRKFWLNSTSESEKKTDTINTLVSAAAGTGNGAPPPAPAAPAPATPASDPAAAAASTK